MKHIQIGQKVYANFGAMYPIVEGMITDFGLGLGDHVVWETAEGEVYHSEAKNFKQPGERSVNGSPIGIFLGEYSGQDI